MTVSFAHTEAEKVFLGAVSQSLPPDIQTTARRKLRQLDAAQTLQDMRVPPGNRLERLPGDRIGQWSIRINDQWRICFSFRDANAYDIEIVDYH